MLSYSGEPQKVPLASSEGWDLQCKKKSLKGGREIMDLTNGSCKMEVRQQGYLCITIKIITFLH